MGPIDLEIIIFWRTTNFLGLKDKWLNSVWFLTVSVPSSDSKRQTLSLTRSQTTGLQSTVHTAKLDTSDAGNKTKVSVGEKLAKIFPLIRILQMQVRNRNVTIKFHESIYKQQWFYLGIITFPCSFLFPLTEASNQDSFNYDMPGFVHVILIFSIISDSSNA